MNTALWVVQIVLAALYIMAGLWKITGQGPMLEKMMPGLSLTLIRVVGLGEALAGLGLVLPAAVRSWAAVAGWAGAILAAEAAVFVVYHVWHRAYVPAGASLVLGLLAAFVAWGRFK
jgi:putative oxidoreductase